MISPHLIQIQFSLDGTTRRLIFTQVPPTWEQDDKENVLEHRQYYYRSGASLRVHIVYTPPDPLSSWSYQSLQGSESFPSKTYKPVPYPLYLKSHYNTRQLNQLHTSAVRQKVAVIQPELSSPVTTSVLSFSDLITSQNCFSQKTLDFYIFLAFTFLTPFLSHKVYSLGPTFASIWSLPILWSLDYKVKSWLDTHPPFPSSCIFWHIYAIETQSGASPSTISWQEENRSHNLVDGCQYKFSF